MRLPPGETFSRDDRLSRREEFIRVQRGGKRVETESLVILYRKNRLGRNRLGIAVSRKVGKAVARNRMKRVVREVFRRNRFSFPSACDVVVIPKKRGASLGHFTYHSLLREISVCRWK